MNVTHGMPRMNHRRDILRVGLRCGGLIALGGLAAWLTQRNGHGACLPTHPCGTCPGWPTCDLPKAREAKCEAARQTRVGQPNDF